MINGIFGGEAGLPQAYEGVQNFIRIFYEAAGATRYNPSLHCPGISYVLAQTSADLCHLSKPSVFKKVGQLTLNFVIINPITTELPDIWYPSEIPRRNFQNALLAFEISRLALHNAVILGSDKKVRKLDQLIKPSLHQLSDIIKCLALIQPSDEAHDTYARLIALLYESLTYEFNDARYRPPAT